MTPEGDAAHTPEERCELRQPEAHMRISAAAARVVADAPPLDPGQLTQLRKLFTGSAQRIRERRAQSQPDRQTPAA